MNARQARRRRQEAARVRRRRLGIAAVLAVVLVAGVGGLAVSAANRDRQPATNSGPLAGLQTGPAPWGANTADLAEPDSADGDLEPQSPEPVRGRPELPEPAHLLDDRGV